MNDQVKIVTMTGVVMSSCPLLGAIGMNRMFNENRYDVSHIKSCDCIIVRMEPS